MHGRRYGGWAPLGDGKLRTFFSCRRGRNGLIILRIALFSGRLVNRSTQGRRRVFAACLCLLAVALPYAPLAGAAWAGHAMSCCTGDHCNIPEHHHRKAAPVETDSHLDCGRNISGITPCSVSSCQNPDKPAVNAVAFVLPSLVFASAPMLVARAVEAARSLEVPRTIQPLPPPPRHAAVL